MKSLAQQVAVVTGATSGIGRAISLALAAQGATICPVGRNNDELQSIARVLGESAQTFCYRIDLNSDADIQKLVADLQRDLGVVDILVHSAGLFSLSPIESASISQLDALFRVNVRAPFVLTQSLLPLLKLRQGQILFVNSTAGLRAGAKVSEYASSKHALKAIADSVRDEVNCAGIRVISLFLGRTATPMQAKVHELEDRMYRPELLMQPDDVAAVAISTLTLPRTTEVTDVSMRPFIRPY